MSKNIIVAGAGHGGLAVAATLAENGFNVTVFEKKAENEMGYDWTDTVDSDSLEFFENSDSIISGLEKSTNITFVPPSRNTIIVQDISEEKLTVKIERKELYSLLISNAKKKGVKIKFKSNIDSPILAGDRVIGVNVNGKKHYADLIIDACGVNSIIRRSLPECVGIQKNTKEFEKFYVYRAIYSKGKEALHNYKVYLLPDGKPGIGWVIGSKQHSDLLIGKYTPFEEGEAEERIKFFKEDNPVIGNKLLRGGSYEEIPIRQTLSILVADGYVAIGDSAFMTIPLLGSGISNSLKAAKILSDVIMKDTTETFSAETLWDYQLRYFEEIGFGMAKMALIKCLVTKLRPEQVDYAFDKKILTRDELTLSDGAGFAIDSALIKKIAALIKDKELVSQLAKIVADLGKLSAISATIPNEYSRNKVLQWASRYDKLYE